MQKPKSAFLKPLFMASSLLGTFTVITIIVPIIWERFANKRQEQTD